MGPVYPEPPHYRIISPKNDTPVVDIITCPYLGTGPVPVYAEYGMSQVVVDLFDIVLLGVMVELGVVVIVLELELDVVVVMPVLVPEVVTERH